MNDLHNTSTLDMFRAHKQWHPDATFVCNCEELNQLTSELEDVDGPQRFVQGPAYRHGLLVEGVTPEAISWGAYGVPEGCVVAQVCGRFDGVLIAVEG